MTPRLILVHGWGFDASFWDPLQAALPDIESLAWDLGFFGKPDRPAANDGRPLIAVGHSFGLLWLLKTRPVAWDALVSINGFPRFVAGSDFAHGVEPRQLRRMAARLSEAPGEMLAAFRRRCGDESAVTDGLDPAALADGLAALAGWDARPAEIRLALCGRSDPIIPPAMSDAAFPGQPLVWHAGGHLLPRQAPAWCAGQLRRLCEDMA
jgi:pimeloyl-[acyl-carrier protein] methyl ester esterase